MAKPISFIGKWLHVELLRLVNAYRHRPTATKPKSKRDQFFEDLPMILLNCLIVAGIAALAVLTWPVTEEMLFAAAKGFLMAFLVQLAKYMRGYESEEKK